MTHWRKAWLSRRLTALTRAARLRASYREELRLRVKACADLRAALAEAGIDPARISCLYLCDQAAAGFLALGDTPGLQRADAAFAAADPKASPAASFAAGIARQVPRFADGHRPAPGASLVDWFAWSLARRGAGPTCPKKQAQQT